MPMDWGKGCCTTSTNERKIEEGKHQEIKDDTEIKLQQLEY